MKKAIAFILLCGSITGLVACSSMRGGGGGRGSRGRMSFDKIDKNSDGVLTFEEVKGLAARRGDPEEMFRRVDADGNGYITRDEFESIKSGRP